MKKTYKVTVNKYSYEVEAENKEEAQLTAEDINWNRVDIEEVKKEMKQYNVNFQQTIQVEAKNEDDAEDMAVKLWEDNEDYYDTRNMEIEVEETND